MTLGMVTAAYIFLTLFMPTLVDIITTANTTMAASSNMSNYPGTAAVMVGAPLWLYFVPGAIGFVVVILILKSDV